jgi:hypothetical protein
MMLTLRSKNGGGAETSLFLTPEQSVYLSRFLTLLVSALPRTETLSLSLSGRMTDPATGESLPLSTDIEMEAKITRVEVSPVYTELL